MLVSLTGYVTTVMGNCSVWESKGLKKEKNKKTKNNKQTTPPTSPQKKPSNTITWGGGMEKRARFPFRVDPWVVSYSRRS